MTAKSLDTQNVWGGGGAIDDTHTSQDILLKMIKSVLTLIYSQLFCCLVSHNKYSDICFDKKTALNSFLYRFYTEM